jgi:tetratricopeptide (TPR) repeat protein
MGFFGLSSIVPGIGGVFGLNIFNTSSDNNESIKGFALGWGKEILGCLSLGAGFKTVSSYAFDVQDGLFFDAGLIFYPNESLNIDFFRNNFINNKIFFSCVIQNLGKEPVTTSAEDLNLRLGFAYNLDVIWTKFFIEQMLLSQNTPTIFGFEINPVPDILKLLFLRASYEVDNQDMKFGFGIHSEDAMLDFSYSAFKREYYLSFNVFFEKSRREMSVASYNEGVILYNEALEEEKAGNLIIEKYQTADSKLADSLIQDRNNTKAAILKNKIDNKLSEYKTQNLSNAQFAENKKDPVSALMFYNKMARLEDNPDIELKIKTLMTNQTVINFIMNSRTDINSAVNARKFITAKREISKLLLILPGDKSLISLQNNVSVQLKNLAEIYYKKARALYNRDLYEDCMTQARNALVYDPDFIKAQELYNLAQSDLNEIQSSQKAYELFKKKNYLGALYIANRILVGDRENQDASALKARILKIFRDNARDYLNEGITYYNNAEYDKAIENFNIVLLVDPSNNVASDYINRAESKQKAIEKLGEIQEQ